MISHLGVPETKVFISFAISTITGPVVGVIVGGTLTTKFGGYTSRKAMYLIIAFGTLCCLVALPTPFFEGVDAFWPFLILIWLLLFFGGAILPGMTGIMLNTVNNN